MEQFVPVSNACSNLEGPWSENSTVPPSSGRYLRSTGAAKHRRRYIIRRALISPGSLLSRWTSGVRIEQCLARDVPCPQEIVAGLLRAATRFRPLKFLHGARAILKVRATQKRMNFSAKERETSTLYLTALCRGREGISNGESTNSREIKTHSRCEMTYKIVNVCAT